MNIKDYLEALTSIERLKQWRRAHMTEEEILAEELMEEMALEEGGRVRSPVSNPPRPVIRMRCSPA